MEAPSSTDLLLIACELAVKVESKPERRDGTDAAVYASSGATLARRILAGAKLSACCSETAVDSHGHPILFCWAVSLQVGAARKTNYEVWLRESPERLKEVWLARKQARALRDSLPHAQRKKKPWGPL
jgi:hypothetical protein